MVNEGPVRDIYCAEEALQLFKSIGQYAEEINNSTFAPTFVTLQSYSIEQFILATTRLFEVPGTRYRLRSLPAILSYVSDNAAELPISEPLLFRKDLLHAGFVIRGFDEMDDESRTTAAMELILPTLPTPHSSPALLALKAIRDKRLAHPEHIVVDDIPKTAWEPAELLLDKARPVVGVLGAYTSTAYVDDNGDYIMSYDSQRSSMATRRLLRKIGIAPPLPHET